MYLIQMAGSQAVQSALNKRCAQRRAGRWEGHQAVAVEDSAEAMRHREEPGVEGRSKELPRVGRKLLSLSWCLLFLETSRQGVLLGAGRLHSTGEFCLRSSQVGASERPPNALLLDRLDDPNARESTINTTAAFNLASPERSTPQAVTSWNGVLLYHTQH